jgi:hypothetical protein
MKKARFRSVTLAFKDVTLKEFFNDSLYSNDFLTIKAWNIKKDLLKCRP